MQVSTLSSILERMVGNTKRGQKLIKKIAELAEAVNGAVQRDAISDDDFLQILSDLNE